MIKLDAFYAKTENNSKIGVIWILQQVESAEKVQRSKKECLCLISHAWGNHSNTIYSTHFLQLD